MDRRRVSLLGLEICFGKEVLLRHTRFEMGKV